MTTERYTQSTCDRCGFIARFPDPSRSVPPNWEVVVVTRESPDPARRRHELCPNCAAVVKAALVWKRPAVPDSDRYDVAPVGEMSTSAKRMR